MAFRNHIGGNGAIFGFTSFQLHRRNGQQHLIEALQPMGRTFLDLLFADIGNDIIIDALLILPQGAD